jgi:polyisoprenoid-binding protein YceI
MKVLVAFVALVLPALAADYTLDLRPESTKVEFTLTDPLHTVHGNFNLKRGEIEFNTDTGKASGQVIVDVASGNSGSDARDSRMHANVLESKKYPEAVFTPDHVEGSIAVPGASTVKVHGTFIIHGMPHEMTMDVHTSGNSDQMHATMAFEIPYVAWGMKDPSNFILKVGKSVHITIETSGPLQQR